MSRPAREVMAGDEVLFRTTTSDKPIQGKVSRRESFGNSAVLILEDGRSFVLGARDKIARRVINLVDKQRRGIAKPGQTPFEVLVFATEFEYNATHTEPDSKKRIVAKFQDYEDAMAFAVEKALNTPCDRVLVRA